ncbi:MAG: hypothetical protein LBS60_08180 [Deltaproteobacteria bacterium]|jgi:hypothetical protein|nr:hypothetical protein [Deltaproteobacteria bacterium]
MSVIYHNKGFCPPEVTKVLFLDIDGVLQPIGRQNRFAHLEKKDEMDSLYSELFNLHHIDYRIYDQYDVTAVYYDWDKSSVLLLKDVLETTNAKIVLSSSWKEDKTRNHMSDLLRIHGLNKYYIDNTIDIKYSNRKEYTKNLIKYTVKGVYYSIRALEILHYVNKYKHITNFVAIDDLNLTDGLKNNFVHTNSRLTSEDAKKAIKILMS